MRGERYLLDTNAIIALLQGNQQLIELLQDAEWIGISIISQIEFLVFPGLYEDKNEPMPTLKGVELLTALLEESDLQPKDLASICQSESIVLDILERKRELTANQLKELAAFFHISPTALFE
ncbi:hypothetical protein [Allocoleopsis sp.]|uniref:hypothetical protein n=1 Tax=Allocoleopsis sp. TaxID=3088169 RepID=UPI002FD6F7B5